MYEVPLAGKMASLARAIWRPLSPFTKHSNQSPRLKKAAMLNTAGRLEPKAVAAAKQIKRT